MSDLSHSTHNFMGLFGTETPILNGGFKDFLCTNLILNFILLLKLI